MPDDAPDFHKLLTEGGPDAVLAALQQYDATMLRLMLVAALMDTKRLAEELVEAQTDAKRARGPRN